MCGCVHIYVNGPLSALAPFFRSSLPTADVDIVVSLRAGSACLIHQASQWPTPRSVPLRACRPVAGGGGVAHGYLAWPDAVDSFPPRHAHSSFCFSLALAQNAIYISARLHRGTAGNTEIDGKATPP